MNTRELFELCRRANERAEKQQTRRSKKGSLSERQVVTHAVLADALGCAPKTIANWEGMDPPKELSDLESRHVCEFFQPRLLEDSSKTMVEEAFRRIPSELVAIWLVDGPNCVVLPDTSHVHYLKSGTRIAKTVSPRSIISLTTYPLRSHKILNLAGSHISDHEKKKYPSRASYLFRDGMCESLLHVPAFSESAEGPKPVLLLSLENKFRDGTEEVEKLVENSALKTIYSESDVNVANELAEDFCDRLLPDMRLLGMVK